MILSIILSSLRLATPLCLAGLGGLFSERSGKANIALEGMMLVGAFASASAMSLSGSPLLGLGAGIMAGLLLASIHAGCVVGLKVNALLSGMVMNLLAVGVTDYLYFTLLNSAYERKAMGASGGSSLVILSGILVILSQVFFHRTKIGLRWRAVGESPAVSRSYGIRVWIYQVSGILLSGILCGLAGAYLVLQVGQFVRGMSAGRGFIALAALITGGWRPLRVAGVCLFFGLLDASQTYLDLPLPTQLLQSSPYWITLILLAFWAGRSKPPAGLSSET